MIVGQWEAIFPLAALFAATLLYKEMGSCFWDSILEIFLGEWTFGGLCIAYFMFIDYNSCILHFVSSTLDYFAALLHSQL